MAQVICGMRRLAAAALTSFDAAIESLKKTPYASMLATGKSEAERDRGAGRLMRAMTTDAAVRSMRRAADQQDKLGQNEVDIPAREMLGDLLVLLHRPAGGAWRVSDCPEVEPNRLNGLLSAGAVAEAIKKPQMAAKFYEKRRAIRTMRRQAIDRSCCTRWRSFSNTRLATESRQNNVQR